MTTRTKRPGSYVMTQDHKDAISKGLKDYHRGRGGKKSITNRVTKRMRTGGNDNVAGFKRAPTTKPRDRHTEHVVKNFNSKRLAHRELKDYRRLKRKFRSGTPVHKKELYDYRKRARRRFALDRAVGRVKSFFKRKS